MMLMRVVLFFTFILSSALHAFPINLKISGAGHNAEEILEINPAPYKIERIIQSNSGKKLVIDLQYKTLPLNRSFPSNLDLTIKNENGDKIAYLFFALNNLSFLSQMGRVGLIFNLDGEEINVQLNASQTEMGGLSLNQLDTERFFQDTIMDNLNFQMIRPVILPYVSQAVREQGFALDQHPFFTEYRMVALTNEKVEFQSNFYSTKEEKKTLLMRVYFEAGSLQTLREAMFAGKYFATGQGPVKVVFYPALGQTGP